LRKVINEIKQKEADSQKVNYSKIAQENGIPRSTIRSRLNKPSQITRGKIFTKTEEEEILEFIKEIQQGTPLTKNGLLDFVNSYLKVEIYS
jgi:hypothetical protein